MSDDPVNAGRDDGEAPRKVLLARPRGYCAGVERAVKTVEVALDRYGPPVYMRRQIVHNAFVVKDLERRGAIFVDEASEVPEGSLLVFSAHGVAPDVRVQARELRLQTIDATCPLVTKVHNEAKRFAAKDYDILLIGHHGHEEVVGTTGQAPRHIHIVEDVASVATVQVRDPERVVWLSQTTLSVSETQVVVEALRERFPRLQDPPSDDICYATQNRQLAVRAIAARVQALVVVGSPNSSNSQRLVDVGRECGVADSFLVDNASELDPRLARPSVRVIGVTSGASVPELLVSEVLRTLAGWGFRDVEEVEATSETMAFSLPREVRDGKVSALEPR